MRVRPQIAPAPSDSGRRLVRERLARRRRSLAGCPRSRPHDNLAAPWTAPMQFRRPLVIAEEQRHGDRRGKQRIIDHDPEEGSRRRLPRHRDPRIADMRPADHQPKVWRSWSRPVVVRNDPNPRGESQGSDITFPASRPAGREPPDRAHPPPPRSGKVLSDFWNSRSHAMKSSNMYGAMSAADTSSP